MTDVIKFIEYLVDKDIINNDKTVQILTDFAIKEDELRTNCITNVTNGIRDTITCVSSLMSNNTEPKQY